MNKNLFLQIIGVVALLLLTGFWYLNMHNNTEILPIATDSKDSTTITPPESSTATTSSSVTPTATLPQIAGLKIEIVTEGTGAQVKSGDAITVDYTGMFLDGKVFDSSIPRGQPLPLVLGAQQVIRGWDLGIVGMKVGEKRKLTIAPELAYGAKGFPGAIPPNSTLVFEVTLKSINK